jgi:hypothetical protein
MRAIFQELYIDIPCFIDALGIIKNLFTLSSDPFSMPILNGVNNPTSFRPFSSKKADSLPH